VSNRNHSAYAGETALTVGRARVRAVTFGDISAEILMESLAKVDVAARASGVSPAKNPIPTKFRKRLACTRTS